MTDSTDTSSADDRGSALDGCAFSILDAIVSQIVGWLLLAGLLFVGYWAVRGFAVYADAVDLSESPSMVMLTGLGCTLMIVIAIVVFAMWYRSLPDGDADETSG